jgi:adenosylcobinamide kinase/adenosylcobinamide-phosphate guanylyltransferase
MARIVLVTGGARSGKSAYAESLYSEKQQVTYLATARISDDEMRVRIHLHRQRDDRKPGRLWKALMIWRRWSKKRETPLSY